MHPFLYKYRRIDKHSLDLLVNGQIYFAGVHQYNDPFEGRLFPNFRLPFEGAENVRASQRQLMRGVRWAAGVDKAYEDLLRNASELDKQTDLRKRAEVFVPLRQRFPKLTDTEFEKFLDELVEELELPSEGPGAGERVMQRFWAEHSVFTLAEECDNLLMWAHYANAHRGFCVEFDLDKLPDLAPFCHPVRYADSYPEIEIETFFDPLRDKPDREKQLTLLFSKAQQWRYEKEWRIIRQKKPGIAAIPLEAITSVVFGYRMPPEDRGLLRRMAAERNIRWREAKPMERSFQLEIRQGLSHL